jgi:hypothetical protein
MFFGIRKIAISGRLEKANFSVSEKLLFECATKKRFFRFPKNRFLRALRKSVFFGIRKIVFSGRHEKAVFLGIRTVAFL